MRTKKYHIPILSILFLIGIVSGIPEDKSMKLFNIFSNNDKLYKNEGLNVIYDMLFCDSLQLYKNQCKTPDNYPWNILFAPSASEVDLLNIIQDESLESRHKILASNKLREKGFKFHKIELYGIIVELGLDGGNDVFASFSDGNIRYINQSEELHIWEKLDKEASSLKDKLFFDAFKVVEQIGPWEKPRRKFPQKGDARITYLVSDGLYFGEAPIPVLFNDPLDSSSLAGATALLTYLMNKSK